MKRVMRGAVLAGVAAAAVTGCVTDKGACETMSKGCEPSVVVKPFGKTKDGQLVQQYTLTGAGGGVLPTG